MVVVASRNSVAYRSEIGVCEAKVKKRNLPPVLASSDGPSDAHQVSITVAVSVIMSKC